MSRVPAFAIPFLILFGFGSGGASDDPYVFSHQEGFLEVVVSDAGGSPPSPGVSRLVQVSVTRQSWEIWIHPDTSESQSRNAQSLPVPGASITYQVNGDGWIDSWASLTDESGNTTAPFTPGHGSAELTVTATAPDGSSASSSLWFPAPTVTEEWTYNRSEGIVVATLESVGGPASGSPLPAGSTVDFVVRARYDSWDVYLSNLGGQTTQNHASTWVEGAQVLWLVESGDGFVTGLSTTDASGTAPATFTGGYTPSVVYAEVAFATGDTASASVEVASTGTAPDPAPDPTPDPGPGEPSWTWARSETRRHATVLAIDQPGDPVPAWSSVSVHGALVEHHYDVYMGASGTEDWRFNFTQPAAYTSLEVAREQGNGSFSGSESQTTTYTDPNGHFTVQYTMGDTDSVLVLGPGQLTEHVAVSFPVAPPDPGGGGGGTEPPPSNDPVWTLQSYGAAPSVSLMAQGPTHDLAPGSSVDIVGVLWSHTWEVWGDQFGNTEDRNHWSGPSQGTVQATVTGGATLSSDWPSVESSGQFQITVTMGSGADPAQVAFHFGGESPATLDFTPSYTPPEDQWTFVRSESEIAVTLTPAAPHDTGTFEQPGTAVPVTVHVEYASWEIWENGAGGSERRNDSDGPAIGAWVQLAVEQDGDASVDHSSVTTDANGDALVTLTTGSAAVRLVADVCYAGATAAGSVDLAREAPWDHSHDESLVEVRLEPDPAQPGWLVATVDHRVREVWTRDGQSEFRNERVSPAIGAFLYYTVISGSASLSDSWGSTDGDGTHRVQVTAGSDESRVQVEAHYNSEMGGGEVTVPVDPNSNPGSGPDPTPNLRPGQRRRRPHRLRGELVWQQHLQPRHRRRRGLGLRGIPPEPAERSEFRGG